MSPQLTVTIHQLQPEIVFLAVAPAAPESNAPAFDNLDPGFILWNFWVLEVHGIQFSGSTLLWEEASY